MSRVAFLEFGFSDAVDFTTAQGIARGQFFHVRTDYGGSPDYPGQFSGGPLAPMATFHKWLYRVQSWFVDLAMDVAGSPFTFSDSLFTLENFTPIANELDFIRWIEPQPFIQISGSDGTGQGLQLTFINGAGTVTPLEKLISQNVSPFNFQLPMLVGATAGGGGGFVSYSAAPSAGAGSIFMDGLEIPMVTPIFNAGDTISGTINPLSYWTYDGIYDAATGAQLITPIPRDYAA